MVNSQDFLFNRLNSNTSYDAYILKNRKNTLSINYKNISDMKNTIRKLECLYKTRKLSHRRISEVALVMMQKLKSERKTKAVQYILSRKYLKFLNKRSARVTFQDRKLMTFPLF